ncbi:MAG: YitT family protein [Lachnospiraceae bacterium]|nr:YitT family protein [Lachnospiraceae bacterium]
MKGQKLSKINRIVEENKNLKMVKQLLMICVGNAMLAVAMNFVITPFNLYCSGAMGVAQLINALLFDVLHIPTIPGIESLGIVYWALNIPILLYGAKKLGKKFLLYTIFSITVLSVFVGLIPVYAHSIIENEVMGCIAAGVFGGIGVGLVLTAGAGCGAGDVLGMVFASTKPGFSVGMMNMIINICIYTICAFAYGLENAIYSILFAAVLSWAMDKWHYQNHYMQVTIYTKIPNLSKNLSEALHRGVTTWQAEGGYTGTPTYMSNIIVTKYELEDTVDKIRGVDPNAFISVVEIGKVHGLFDKRFSQ